MWMDRLTTLLLLSAMAFGMGGFATAFVGHDRRSPLRSTVRELEKTTWSPYAVKQPSSSSTGLQMNALGIQKAILGCRGGATKIASPMSLLNGWNQTPQTLFNSSFIALAMVIITTKFVNARTSLRQSDASASAKKPSTVASLQRRFLPVFWLLRISDWLQGPYFYEVYASKILQGGKSVSMDLVSKLFLTGFASTALFGPAVGRAADQYGRKKATIAFTALYALGALSTKSVFLQVLFMGRILSGIGTSLLFSAPEAWLVGASQANNREHGDDPEGKYLGETFGLAYSGDSLVAIAAGQMAAWAASTSAGPTGPFLLSTIFLALGGLLTSVLWKENKAETVNAASDSSPSIRDAVKVVAKDPKILFVGGVQSLFEAAMYIFVLQWPPALSSAISKFFASRGATTATPYGTVFSCFMACCLLGSTLFGQVTGKMAVPTEHFTMGMLSVATAAMTVATMAVSGVTTTASSTLAALIASFFAFEACVGMYFPSIGTLRSKYVPDTHRSVIMNLFGIPLNVLVVSVFLSINKLGLKGALSISSLALGLATLCMAGLDRIFVLESKSKASESS